MATIIGVLGGIGLFLLGMTIMTDGLKALAGSALRTVLAKAAATPMSGAFWGAGVTLLVQSSSAVTMTTIGMVSAGLLTFPQGLGLVFGANVGTTGTGWLVALIGVRVSLSTYALPLIFVGALTKLLGKGRVAASGGALAGFALVLYGLTTLQQGMGGLAESLQPSDLPAVLGAPGVGFVSGVGGLLALIGIGLAMTAVMQSSTAAIAVTISAYFAGAVSLEQGLALIIGQNIGTATSSALAAIGASTTAKRLAVAYILFKIIAALVAIIAFPVTVRLAARLSTDIDGMTLLAAYHTAYNVVGVALLLPATQWFTRVVERLLPSKQTALQRALDPSALASPVVAIEAARRVVADILVGCAAQVTAALAPERAAVADDGDAATSALAETRDFLSELRDPPQTEGEQGRLTSLVHALDHAGRLADNLAEGHYAAGTPDPQAASLSVQAMAAVDVAGRAILAETALSAQAGPIGWTLSPAVADALADLARLSRAMDGVQRDHRAATLAAVAPGGLPPADAFARIETVRALGRIVHHAWRSTTHLYGEGADGAGAQG